MDNVGAVANELAMVMSTEVLTLPDKVLVDTAEGNMLDRKALDFGMTRTESETDESFRKRILERIQRPIVSGNKNHYIDWAKSVAGVGEAKVISCWEGNGTVKVIVQSSDYDVPSDEVIENVASFIEDNRPIGASITVTKAIPVSLNVDASITIESGNSLEDIKSEFVELLQTYLSSISFDEKTVLSYYKIGDIIFGIEGVIDILEYTINGGKSSLKTEFEEFFKLNEVTLNGY